MAKLKSNPDDKKKKKAKLDLDNPQESDDEEDDTCVGHALWEDEDNGKKKANTKLGIGLRRVKKETSISKSRGPKKASHSKLTSLTKFSHAQTQEKRNKKRQKLQEEKEIYKKPNQTKGTSNRKERGAARNRMPHVILSDRLEQLRALVESRPNSGAFHKPVPREQYPTYYEMIHEPIDLQTIREQNRKYHYKKGAQLSVCITTSVLHYFLTKSMFSLETLQRVLF